MTPERTSRRPSEKNPLGAWYVTTEITGAAEDPLAKLKRRHSGGHLSIDVRADLMKENGQHRIVDARPMVARASRK